MSNIPKVAELRKLIGKRIRWRTITMRLLGGVLIDAKGRNATVAGSDGRPHWVRIADMRDVELHPEQQP